MKVCSFENRIDELYEVVHKNHLNYCNKHKYEYYEVNNFNKWKKRVYPHFHKFDLIKEALTDDCEYLLYLDFDAVFTNFDIKIESFIVPNADIIMSKDFIGGRCMYDYGWNNGVILIKNTDRVHKLFNVLTSDWLVDLFSFLQRINATAHYDQNAFEFLTENLEEYKGIVTEISSKSFNSYLPGAALIDTNKFTPRRFYSSFCWLW